MFKKIKILHIVLDEKFTDSAYKSFESIAPLCNTFLLPTRNKKMKYIKETPIRTIDPLSFKNPFFMKSLEKYHFIVLHSLTRFNQGIVLHASPNLKFVWIGMGYDYYDIIYKHRESLYQEETMKIVKTLKSNTKLVSSVLNTISQSFFYHNIEKRSAVERINFFAPVLENEYKMVASKFNSNFPEYIDWNYGTMVKVIDDKLKFHYINGNNILVGNSASPQNNHLEIFKFLRNQQLSGKQIICPLSYGNLEYANILKKKAKTYFGEAFLSVDNFMPFDNYISLISSCSNVIMNHHRQQGAGNIAPMLYMGAKIYLNEINPLFDFFNENGAKIFTIDELYNNPSLLDIQLSKKDVKKNRDIIKMSFDEKAILNKTEGLIKKVLNSFGSSNYS